MFFLSLVVRFQLFCTELAHTHTHFCELFAASHIQDAEYFLRVSDCVYAFQVIVLPLSLCLLRPVFCHLVPILSVWLFKFHFFPLLQLSTTLLPPPPSSSPWLSSLLLIERKLIDCRRMNTSLSNQACIIGSRSITTCDSYSCR